jgi:hypothetical protein
VQLEEKPGAVGESSVPFSFRAYRPEDKVRLLDLVELVWDERRRRNHDHLWDWQHARDGLCPEPRHLGRVMERTGEIVGYSGGVPVQFVHRGREFWGTVLLDTFLHPQYRGLGRHLMAHHIATCSLGLGAPIVRAHALWKRVRRRENIVIHRVTKRVLPLDVRPFLRRRGWPAPAAALVQPGWSVGQRLRSAWRSPAAGRSRLGRVLRFPPEMDAFARAVAEGFQFSVLHDAAFLDWRYVSAPVAYEKWLLWEGEALAGYAVYRVTRVNGRPVLLLVEIAAVGEKARHYSLLLAHVAQAARTAGVCDIQTLETGCPVLAETLTRWGFMSRPDEVSVVGTSNVPGTEESVYAGGWGLTAGDAEFEFIFFNQGVDDLKGDRLADG